MESIDQSPVMDVILVGIIACYFGIAIQFGFAIKDVTNNRAKWSLGLLMAIFVFCSLCGYLNRLVPVSFPLMILEHGVLLTCAFGYLLTRQITILCRELEN